MRILDSIGVLVGADPSALVNGIQKAVDNLTLLQRSVSDSAQQMTSLNAITAQLRGTLLALPTAIVGTKAVRAWADEERSINNLNSALIVQGKWRKGLTEELTDFSSKMQNASNVSDDMVRDVMAMGLNMGMTTKRVKQMTAASIGMTKISPLMRSPIMAMRMLMMAEKGQTAFLSRYGIVVDKTKSKQDQFQQVLKQSMRGFQIAQLELGTLTGQTIRFGLVTGDAMEALGKEITRTLRLTQLMKLLGDGVQRLTTWFTSLSIGARSVIVWLGVLITVGLAWKPVAFLLSLAFKTLITKVIGFGIGCLKLARIMVSTVIPAMLTAIALAGLFAAAFTLGDVLREIKIGNDTLGGHLDSFFSWITERTRVTWTEMVPSLLEIGFAKMIRHAATNMPKLAGLMTDAYAVIIRASAGIRVTFEQDPTKQLEIMEKAAKLADAIKNNGVEGIVAGANKRLAEAEQALAVADKNYADSEARTFAEYEKGRQDRLKGSIGNWEAFKKQFDGKMYDLILFLKASFGDAADKLIRMLIPLEKMLPGDLTGKGKGTDQLAAPTTPKLAGAFEMGSVDAYRIIVGGQQRSLDKIADNTGKMVTLLEGQQDQGHDVPMDF